MGSRTYDAVCFDLDHTLCEPIRPPATVLDATFDRVGVEPFCTWDEIRQTIPTLPMTQTTREFLEVLFDTVATDAGIERVSARTLADAYLAESDPTAVRLTPGGQAALEHASERATGIALITNGERPRQRQKLDALGITDAFDVRVYTDPEQGILPKPDTAPFDHALSALAVEPGRTIHVGDSVYADIAGANAAGVDSVLLDGSPTESRERRAAGREQTAADGGTSAVSRDVEPTYRLPTLESFTSIL